MKVEINMYDPADDKMHLVLVNAVVIRDGKVLIAKRSLKEPHMPGKWTIPGGKVEKTDGNNKGILLESLKKETEEEVGVQIKNDIYLVYDNAFIRSTGHHVVALTFLCFWKSGKERPLEDTTKVAWVKESELDRYDFAPKVEEYITDGFKASIQII